MSYHDLMLKPRILFVDDEIENLNSFKAAYRKRYEIFTAGSGEEALRFLETGNVHIVITDQRMPKMTGVELLDEVRRIDSKIITMLITAYHDLKPAVDAINKGEIYHYITKPWNVDYLGVIIDRAFDKYKSSLLLEIQNQKLLKANKELDRFIYSASHDLRGPLTSIVGLTRLIREEKMSRTVEEYLNMIDTSAEKLEEALKSFAYFSENMRLVDEPVEMENIEGFVKSVVRDVSGISNDFLRLRVEVEVEQTGKFATEKHRLRILLSQLLFNAATFQDFNNTNRFVKIEVNASEDVMVLKVKDNGVGIPANIKSKIFDMFFRGNAQSRGTGIGLYIVNDAVERLNGEIHVESRPGDTCFTIKLNKPQPFPVRNKS